MMISRLSKFRKRPFSISKKFVVFILCFAVLNFLISLGLFFKHYYNIKSTIYQKLENQAGRIENTFIDAIEYTEHSMNFIAQQIADNKKQRDYKFIKRLLVSYRVPDNRIMEFSTFAWANDEHRFIVSSNKGLHFDQKLYLSDRDYIPKTISNPMEIHLGKPVYGIYSHKYSIPAGYGVVDKNKKYLGAVITSFVISGLERKFDEVINSNGVSFILMQKDGLFIAASPKVKNEEVLKYLNRKMVEIASKDSGIINGAKIFSDENFGSIYYHKLKDLPYIIFTVHSKQLERVQIENVVFNDVIIFGLLFALVSVLLFLLYVSLVKPIVVIAKAAKSIADGNYEIEITKYNSVEIKQLAHSILSIKRLIKKENLLKYKLRANEDLQRITKSINHDLRSYASGVSGLANLIIEETDPIQIAKYSNLIVKRSDEIFSMAQELLSIDLSMMDIRKTSKAEEFSIKELLHELIFVNRDFAEKNRVKVSLNFHNDIPLIISDKMAIRRIFDNIVSNAIKYSNENTEVRILLSYLAEENKIKVEVIDEGIGMTSDQIKKALNGEGSKIDKDGLSKIIDSHGFGLPIVKKLVDSIGARMEIESKKFEGTKARLWFDLKPDKTDTLTNVDPKADENKTNKGVILVCDDELINRVVLDRILRNAGYKVFTAENGKEALELIDSNAFDLIFTDLEMPLMNGISLIKAIRSGGGFKKFKNFATIPVVVVSSNNSEEIRNQTLDAGANCYLNKIYDKSKILEVVVEMLNRWVLL